MLRRFGLDSFSFWMSPGLRTELIPENGLSSFLRHIESPKSYIRLTEQRREVRYLCPLRLMGIISSLCESCPGRELSGKSLSRESAKQYVKWCIRSMALFPLTYSRNSARNYSFPNAAFAGDLWMLRRCGVFRPESTETDVQNALIGSF
jgi:hypothetical protein